MSSSIGTMDSISRHRWSSDKVLHAQDTRAQAASVDSSANFSIVSSTSRMSRARGIPGLCFSDAEDEPAGVEAFLLSEARPDI